MARLRGLGSFLLVTLAVLAGLRLVHVGVPALLPGVRPGPVSLGSLADVERRAGFPPVIPAYHPIALGERPPSITLTRQPVPTVVVAWRGERYLVLTQRQGGPAPDHPPISRPLSDVPGSLWWGDGEVHHLVVERAGFWLTVETDLPLRDLRRIADTLRPYR